jgi:N-acetylglucosaminyldiphosphoundecaprenol N-acetyl-beta-D-mannosaminyltransferase
MFALNECAGARTSDAYGGNIVRKKRPPAPLVEIGGFPVNIRNPAHAVDSIIKRLSHPDSFLVCTLNLDHLVKLRAASNLAAAYARAEFVTADGFPIVTLSRLRGCRLLRTTGADLIKPLCAAAAQRRLSIFLMGSTFEVLRGSAHRLAASFPELDIAGVYAPPQNFSLQSATVDEAISVIQRSGARLCFLALGAPLQELFGLHAIDKTQGIAFLPIGAGLDFLTGAQVRCPPYLQNMNLEWAWRLARDPRRLSMRYLRCAILFAKLLTQESMSLLVGSRRYANRIPTR